MSRIVPCSVAALVAGLLLAGVAASTGGCAWTTPATAMRDAGAFAMRPGERIALPDGTLRYARVASDSRCPPDVRCVWAGEAEVAMEWTPAGGATETFQLHLPAGDAARMLGARRLVLVALERGAAPRAQFRLERAP